MGAGSLAKGPTKGPGAVCESCQWSYKDKMAWLGRRAGQTVQVVADRSPQPPGIPALRVGEPKGTHIPRDCQQPPPIHPPPQTLSLQWGCARQGGTLNRDPNLPPNQTWKWKRYPSVPSSVCGREMGTLGRAGHKRVRASRETHSPGS
ncbi:hypothetical protein XENTR_v10019058 [Xenopus tropicalis]|nr:hypothetical protein XENTR_v10019058 [Xenopus tropicalis]